MTAANIIPYQPPALPSIGPLLPNSIGEAIQVAELMAKARMVPEHLQGSVADCFLVVNQARLWRMDPFSLAQGTSFIHGKMMYEGKVIAAVVHSLGNLSSRLSYEFDGAGDNRTVVVSGTLRGEDKARTVSVRLKDAKTNNKVWTTQPDQQLAYHGARVWARRHVPEVIQGVYSPEEFPEQRMRDVTPENVPFTISERVLQRAPSPPPPPPAQTFSVNVPYGGEPATYPRTRGGAKEAFKEIVAVFTEGHPEIIGLNNEILDEIATRVPALAEEISNLRAAAAEALAFQDDPEPEEKTFVERFVNGDEPEPDDFPGTVPPKPNP